MPIVFGDHEAGYGLDEAEAGLGELMALYLDQRGGHRGSRGVAGRLRLSHSDRG